MRKQNNVGLRTRNVVYAGHDPREVSGKVLGQAEHWHIPPVPIGAQKTGGQTTTSGLDGGLPPNDTGGDFLPKKLTVNPEGTK